MTGTSPAEEADAPTLPAPVRAAVHRLARVDQLLVASDYDGVLAPIAAEPARAYPLPAAMAALHAMADLPGTTVAVVSGRPREELARFTDPSATMHLVGSHGAEVADGLALTPAQAALRDRLASAMQTLVHEYPGVWLEHKPASVAVHTRGVARDVAEAALAAVRQGPQQWPGVHTTTGKEILELAVVAVHKGTAVAALRTTTGAGTVLYLGDDVTDENAFAVLDPQAGDVGIKVGTGDTRATHRVADPQSAAVALTLLQQTRAG